MKINEDQVLDLLSNGVHKGVQIDNALWVFVLASMERVPFPLPHNASSSPLPWTSLAFHPLGLLDLRRRLGKPSLDPDLYKSFQDRFEAADLAWFASGLAFQSCNIKQEEFYPELDVLRSNTERDGKGTEARAALRKRVRDLTFDCVCPFSVYSQHLIHINISLPCGIVLLEGQHLLSMSMVQLALVLLSYLNLSNRRSTSQVTGSRRTSVVPRRSMILFSASLTT